jgi:hypothetical protein
MENRSQKLQAAKEKLNRFQKTRTNQSFALQSALTGTLVNGQQYSSLMSNNGSIGDMDSRTRRSVKSESSNGQISPYRAMTVEGHPRGISFILNEFANLDISADINL